MTKPHRDEEPAYRVDGAHVARERFYEVACDPRRAVAVEACAGAGKTWMLVSRIVRALLDGTPPHEILAITFTRKAAGEMRQRLDDWLAELASPATPDDARVEWLVQRGLPRDAAERRAGEAAALHERVLAAGRGVRILTFHGWFSQLMRAAPFELLARLGLHPGMELIDDPSELADELLRRFHAALLDDAALRADYTALVGARGRARTRDWLLAAWDRRVEIELADAAGTLDDSVPGVDAGGLAHPSDVLLGAAWRERLAAVAFRLSVGGVRAAKAAAGLDAALAAADGATAFDAAWRALFTDKDEPRKLGSDAAVGAAQEALAALGERIAAHEAHLEHARMARLARLLLREYAVLKRARGVADMNDLERCALLLLRDAELAGWVQQRLDAQVRQLLVDEFQDTSPLQWQALHAWLAAYAGSGGGGAAAPVVFVVGDPKQSIYRFRRAEPRVFAAAREFVVQGLGGSVLECDHTRRNPPALLAVLNDVFAAAQADGAYEGFRAHTTACDDADGPAVLALPAVERPPRPAPATSGTAWRDSLTTPRLEPEEVLRQLEAERVADAIAALLRDDGVPPGDVMVLARRRTSLRLVAGALQRRHLPFAAPEDAALADSAVARDLVALLDALASPTHDVSLAQALRSALFGCSDDDLVALAQRVAGGAPGWWAALADAPAAALSPALQRAQRLLARWQQAAQALPPHDLLDLVVHEGEVHARVAARVPAALRADALGAIDALLAQALELDGGRYATPYNFVRALRRRRLLATPPRQADAVQLLTVHGAKGLEAPYVFVTDADPQPLNGETSTLLVDWPVDAPAPRCCAFVAAESRCPPALAALLAREQAARAREELNGLYVAMTRASARLVVSSTEPSRRGAAPSWWQRLLPHAGAWHVEPVAAPPGVEAAASLRQLPAWSGAPQPEGVSPTVADSVAAQLGRAVHRLLEWTMAAGVERRGDAFAEAARQAAAEFGLAPAQSVVVARHAALILDSAACRPFFDRAALRWAGNEVDVVDGEGHALRIDRLVACPAPDGGTQWWVLDYKLARAPQDDAGLRAQLARYRAAVQALQPGDVVRAAFVTGDGALVELP